MDVAIAAHIPIDNDEELTDTVQNLSTQ